MTLTEVIIFLQRRALCSSRGFVDNPHNAALASGNFCDTCGLSRQGQIRLPDDAVLDSSVDVVAESNVSGFYVTQRPG